MKLYKRELESILKLVESFEQDSVEIFVEGNNGIGQIVTARLKFLDAKGHEISVEKEISGVDTW